MTVRPPSSGTVYTPEDLAQAVVTGLGSKSGDTWLDPCVGEGALVRAVSATNTDPANVMALDLAVAPGAHDHLATTLRGVDFLAWARRTPERFSRIVANPPYVPVARLPRKLRESALRTTGPGAVGVALGANYWCAFLLASLSLLQPDGALAFILPASFEYANYACELRNVLPSLFGRVEVHRCLEPMFGRVRDGCVVLMAHRFAATTSRYVRAEHARQSDLVAAIAATRTAKGTAVVTLGRTGDRAVKTRALSEIVSLRLGGVTGDARYFLMTDEERRSRGLPSNACTPVLTRSAHLVGALATKTLWRELSDSGERIWLFNPPKKLTKKGAVRAYLRRPRDAGGCNRDAFKVATRHPWYRTPLPRAPHGFMSGMSRFGPWICLNGMRSLTASNTLYVVRFVEATTRARRAAWALALMTSEVRRQLENVGRVYPDGLRKHEPGDLARIRVPIPPTSTAAAVATYRRAVRALLAGDAPASAAIADAWVYGRSHDQIAPSTSSATRLPRLA